MIACIPTKGRFETKTYKLFAACGIDVYHFIEPDELVKYDVPNKVDIKENNRGISYVRNFILEWAKNKTEWIIMCDDDVKDFGIAVGTKCHTTDANIFKKLHDKIKSMPFEMVGLNYRQHAWHEKNHYNINKKFVEVCVMINVSSIRWKYRSEFNTKEDRDFVLQTMKYGNGIIKFNKYFFNCPGVGTNKGGLQEAYKQNIDQQTAQKICKEWHPYMTLQDKNGRVDIKFDFEKFCSVHKKICK